MILPQIHTLQLKSVWKDVVAIECANNTFMMQVKSEWNCVISLESANNTYEWTDVVSLDPDNSRLYLLTPLGLQITLYIARYIWPN